MLPAVRPRDSYAALPIVLAAVAAAGADPEACRRSSRVDPWVPRAALARSFVHHKNRCLADHTDAARVRRAPAACDMSMDAVARCLRERHGVRRVVLVGDSITGQLWGSPLCARATERGFGAGGATANVTALGDAFAVATARRGAVEWSYTRLRGKQTAERYARALAAAAAEFYDEPALWVANFGLWHLVCDDDERPPEACVDADYEARVADALATLARRARGPILWRATTAVHRELFPRKMAPRDVRKFRGFDNGAVARLNAVAKRVVEGFGARVSLEAPPDSFNLTLDRGDGHLRGDARHYGSGVLQTLETKLFLDVCVG